MERKICIYTLIILLICIKAYAGANVPGILNPQTFNGINWSNIHNIGGLNINWTDIRVFATSHGGDHSGINWQSFGA